MKLLLDTHTFIWWASEPDKLSRKVLTACENPNNTLILSVVSAWEIEIKRQLGRLNLDMPLEDLIDTQQQSNDLQIMTIALKHILALKNLPAIHNDPFDRLLIAQSNVEGLTLATMDKTISAYSVSILW
jgi:PIN domain nuclease of toxin-antitoxin system